MRSCSHSALTSATFPANPGSPRQASRAARLSRSASDAKWRASSTSRIRRVETKPRAVARDNSRKSRQRAVKASSLPARTCQSPEEYAPVSVIVSVGLVRFDGLRWVCNAWARPYHAELIRPALRWSCPKGPRTSSDLVGVSLARTSSDRTFLRVSCCHAPGRPGARDRPRRSWLARLTPLSSASGDRL